MVNFLCRSPRHWIAAVLIAISFAVVGLHPTQAQRPPGSPPGSRNPQSPLPPAGNRGNMPGNPANPVQPNSPVQPDSNPNGIRNGPGLLADNRPSPSQQPDVHT